MKVIKPKTISLATDVISSTATEQYATWSSATTYSKNAFVDYGYHIYESLVNNNTNHQPDVSTTQWVQIGPDNTHAMFDLQVSTRTTATTSLTVDVRGSLCNSLALIDITGSSVDVIVTDGITGPEFYNETFQLETSEVFDWYMYFYEPFSFITELIITDIPPYGDAIFNVTINAPAGEEVAIGEFILGTIYSLGDSEYGATAGIIDYSRKETDEFGVTTFVQRAYSKRMTDRFLLENNTLRNVQRILADLRSSPAVWIGSDDTDYSPLTVYGFYRDFSIDISYPTFSYCSIEIEGLI